MHAAHKDSSKGSYVGFNLKIARDLDLGLPGVVT